MLNNISPVTKNLLLLNVLMFALTYILELQHVDLRSMLSVHAVNSPLFEPYQIVSHFFMHDGPLHIFMNMFGLVMFGSLLEKLWGAKRFFIFYVSTCFGAWLLTGIVDYMELAHYTQELKRLGFSDLDFFRLDNDLIAHPDRYMRLPESNAFNKAYNNYQLSVLHSSLGASGGVFGILAAFAILFPNTELMLLFFPMPIKAKYLIGGYVAYEIFRLFNPQPHDNIGHLAHIGGAIVGAIFVLVWRRNRTHFY